MAEQIPAASSDTAPVVEPDTGDDSISRPAHRGAGIWGLLLVLVIVFGYLTASRREAIGRFVEQVADIVRDFRGYDPEF
jgi:hypothetical protein